MKNYDKTKKQSLRKNCIDVFNAFLVCLASFVGIYDFPIIMPTYDKPNALIRFSKCLKSKNYNCWVHFYEDDYLFRRIWLHPRKYLPILKKFNGVILPDFSVYRDMPFAMQIWNIYRSRAIGFWLQLNGIKVIPNLRFGDVRTYEICCDGISKGCVISFGTHGLMKNRTDRYIVVEGIASIINYLKPSCVVIYGSADEHIRTICQQLNIELLVFKDSYYQKISIFGLEAR